MKKQNVLRGLFLSVSVMLLLPVIAFGAKEVPSATSSSSQQTVANPSQGNLTVPQQEEVKNTNQNAGETTQNQEKETEQINNSGSASSGEAINNQEKTSNSAEDTGLGEQNKNKIQEQTQIQTQQLGQDPEEKNQRSLNRRSQVANAVQEMERIAGQNPGLGEQIRTIAQSQNSNQDAIEDSVQKVQNRNRVVKFLIGPDYGKINEIESKLQEQQQKIQEMNQIASQLENEGDSDALRQQIAIMEDVADEINQELENEQSTTSLFGWLFKWFAR